MDAESACQYINESIYKPGWSISARTEPNFENTIRVRFEWSAPNYNKENAPEYEVVSSGLNAEFLIPCRGDCDQYDVYRAVLHRILECEQHEAREAFRVGPALEAPFHPHTHKGMDRWGNTDNDLTFGSVR